MPPSPPPPGPLFSVRTALILLLACVTAAIAGVLTYVNSKSAPEAGLVGGSALGAAVIFFNKIIDI